jgi:hypothetical protein
LVGFDIEGILYYWADMLLVGIDILVDYRILASVGVDLIGFMMQSNLGNTSSMLQLR